MDANTQAFFKELLQRRLSELFEEAEKTDRKSVV